MLCACAVQSISRLYMLALRTVWPLYSVKRDDRLRFTEVTFLASWICGGDTHEGDFLYFFCRDLIVFFLAKKAQNARAEGEG